MKTPARSINTHRTACALSLRGSQASSWIKQAISPFSPLAVEMTKMIPKRGTKHERQTKKNKIQFDPKGCLLFIQQSMAGSDCSDVLHRVSAELVSVLVLRWYRRQHL